MSELQDDLIQGLQGVEGPPDIEAIRASIMYKLQMVVDGREAELEEVEVTDAERATWSPAAQDAYRFLVAALDAEAELAEEANGCAT